MKLPDKGIYVDENGEKWNLSGFATQMEDRHPCAILTGPDGGTWTKDVTTWDLPPILTSAEEIESARKEQILTKSEVLKRYYGYSSFREGQEDVVDALLSGKDVLAVMPTGAGKSLCYQVPALLLEGITLVVSPLISLMKDQVQALVQNGIPAAYLNSSLSERQFTLALANMARGKYKIIYIAPERLNTPRFLAAIQNVKVSMLAVDEAHCISQWGQDFRPSYLEIVTFPEQLGYRPIICAFTATATEKVREDILKLLCLNDPFVRITGFDRKNLYYSVLHPQKKDAELLRVLKPYKGFAGIVYCATRKKVEAVHELLLANGYSATRYHAGLSEEERQTNQEDFSYDRREIMVATNAFGMGIDKSNVRFIIHYNMPKDPESYYQEAGRAGRDGDRSDCILLYNRQDILTQKFFIEHMGEESPMTEEELKVVQRNAQERLNRMVRFCETPDCLRKYMLEYFGENAPVHCGFCLNCLSPVSQKDVSSEAIRAINCIDQTGQRFGRTTIIDVLRGGETKNIQMFHLDTALSYGCLHSLSREEVSALLDRLIELEAITTTTIEGRNGSFPVLKLGPDAADVLRGDLPVTILSRSDQKKQKKKASGSEDVLLQDVDRDLYEALRAYRRKLSRTRGVPPYVIFSDSVLKELAQRQPMTMEEMEGIKGIGVVKLREYGSLFLKEIQKYKAGI